MSPLTDLAREILRNAEIIDGATSQSKNTNSLDVDEARTALLDATHKLTLQAQTPEAYLFQQMWSVTDTFILRTMYSLKLPQNVPLAGSIAYNAVALQVGVPVDKITRLFRYAITLGFFTEPQDGTVAHSPASRLLAVNTDAFDAMGMILAELGPATHAFPEALERFGTSEEPNETAWNVANATDLGMYELLEQNYERGRRFGGAMRFFSGDGGNYIQNLLAAFPWTEPAQDREDFLVVDVGGGTGSVSIRLAESTGKMRFVVQDHTSTVQEGEKLLAAQDKVMDRVTFMPHDFLSPQSVVADVYFFRWIFHNWADGYCIRILRGLIPALKPGARVMVYEHVMEDGVDALLSKKKERYLDLFMLCACNSRERTEADWRSLFATADGRFMFQGVTTVPGASLGLVQAVWEG